MREHIPGRGSAIVAVVACLLVVCSALAVAPGTASAAHVDGEISYSGGELTVTVFNASEGNFTGGEERVTVEIGGEEVSPGADTPGDGESNYTYTIGQSKLSELKSIGKNTEVAVFHNGKKSFNRTIDIQYLALKGSGEFNEGGELRLPVGTNFGVANESEVQIEVSPGDEAVTATYRMVSNNSYLVLNRDTLGTLGVLRSTQDITVSSSASYVQGSVTQFDVTGAGASRTTGERLSDSAVRFQSPLFEDGQAYVVNASIGDAQYLQTVDAAGDQTIEINSLAVAAESSVDLTVKNSGNTVVSKQVSFSTEQLTGNVTDSGAVKFDSLPNRVGTGNVTVWAEARSGFERYDARLNQSTLTLTLRNGESLPQLENANQTALLVQSGGEPLYATVTLQAGNNTSATGTPPGDGSSESSILDNLPILPALAFIVAIIVVAAIVFLALQKFGSGTTKLNLGLFGSSKQESPGESPGVETADVSVEVVDEVADKTYPHATKVIARKRNQGRSTGSRMGSGPGGTAGGAGLQGVNSGEDVEEISLAAGKGEAELGYGNWVLEVRQKGQTIGQRPHDLKYGYESDHIALSVDPYTVEVTVTGGPNREPLGEATVEATADVGGWKQRQRTDPKGRVQFEIPRSASNVSFTAKHGNLPPAESQYRIEQAVQDDVNLSIAEGAGTMRVETTVGDLSWPGVEVNLTPVSEEAKAYANDGTFTVNSEGRQRVEKLPAGEYEVRAHPQLEAVDTTAAVERVTVGDGDTAEVTLSIGISYRMSAAERERLDELRARIDGLSSDPDRDVAIQRYYGTVLTSMLDVVEGVESAPERAVETGFSPDETVEALLDATETGITAVDGAMSERRNVSLFDACASMPPATVAWNGTATLDAFFDRVDEGKDHERRALSDRLRAVDKVLDQQWGEVNEMAPARKLHDRIGELARETGNVDDELTAVAQAYVGVCLLDAVEGIFEHDALVDRLNSGSY